MTTPVFTCVGLNHNTAPVEERERLAFTRTEAVAALQQLKEEFGGVALLSTCNRTELYTTLEPGDGARLIETLNSLKGANVAPSRFYSLQHSAAAEHLYRVAAGIDSMVLGESQILGQVREAFSAATEAGSLSGIISHMFHSAVRVGKRARSETNIGGHAVSVSSAAVALARRSLTDLHDRTILVISAGAMGKLVARSLAQQPGSRILVANRTPGRAEAVAETLGAETTAVSFDDLRAALVESDIVISGTGSSTFILGPEQIAPVMHDRADRDLLFIDIAVPRDVDPAVRALRGVHLFDIDDIEAVTEEGWSGRHSEVEAVELIVSEAVLAFEAWWASRDVLPVISALYDRAETIREVELQRALEKMPDLDDAARARIEAMTQAIVKKMLDRPVARLKENADTGRYVEAIEDLFDVESRRGPRP
jgi:glutamyl-tRNA reductase